MGGRGGKIVNLQEDNEDRHTDITPLNKVSGMTPEIFGRPGGKPYGYDKEQAVRGALGMGIDDFAWKSKLASLEFHPSSLFLTIFIVLTIMGSIWCLCRVIKGSSIWDRLPVPVRAMEMQNANQRREQQRERV